MQNHANIHCYSFRKIVRTCCKSVDKSVPKPKLLSKAMPVRKSNLLERRNSIATIDRKVICPQLTPALYATPKATPLPDSPSSFSPSPYIINHKRRGPRLLKSFSEHDVASRINDLDDNEKNGSAKNTENKVMDSTKSHCVTFAISDSVTESQTNGAHDSPVREEIPNGAHEASSKGGCLNVGETGSNNGDPSRIARNSLAMEKDILRFVALNSERGGEPKDFFDPQDSTKLTSHTSNIDCDDNSARESSMQLAAITPIGEFYDAWEELSSDSGLQSSLRDCEAELLEMRLNLSMETERRMQAEETLNDLQIHWQRIRQQLTLVGLTLPAFPFVLPKGEVLPNTDPAVELCQQVYLARFVSDSIGRGIAKAEVEMEKECEIEAKNFEIARLWDRLHYYEAVNREMSQRNQEAVEMARRCRRVRKRRQRWVWGSIVASISLGTAALAWSYLPATKESSSTPGTLVPEHDGGVNY